MTAWRVWPLHVCLEIVSADYIPAGAALAEHIGQSKVARVHQQSVNHKLLEVQQSARQKEIAAWLAPAAYDVLYYQNDLDNARALRHPKTCQWIFEKEEMGLLFGEGPDGPGNGTTEKSLLWIHAKPVCKMQSHCTSQRRQISKSCNTMYSTYRSRPS